MSQQGQLDLVTGDVQTLTGNSGGAVGPDGAGNIDILGQDLYTVVGDPPNNTLTITPTAAGYPITPYVVGPAGQAGYQTIQAALDAANAAGGGLVFVQGGVYEENLTCYPNITVTGPGITSGYPGGTAALEIQGNHTPATTGIMTFNNVTFTTAVGDTFQSNAGGTAELNFTNCGCGVTDGYFLNVPNWTGVLSFWDFNPSLGTNDGGINNPTGGAAVYCYEAGIGIGSTRTMQISGTMIFNQGEIMCPVQFNSGSNASLANNIFGGTMTITGNATLATHHGYHETGANACVVMSSSANVSFFHSVFESSNNPAIDGAGTGTLFVGSNTFLDNSEIAATLTIDRNNTFDAGALKATSATLSTATEHAIPLFGAGGLITEIGPLTDGQLVVGSTGNAPAAATLTAGTNVSITNGAGSITINANTESQTVNLTSLDDTDSPYTVLSTDYYFSCDVNGGPLTINLPNAPDTGRVFIVKDSGGDASTNNITITTPGGTVTFDGSTSYVMNVDFQADQFIFNGTNYEVF